ncbi:MAG: CoA-binding protein [Sphingobacteriales bacterium]|nr:MAG: CoA-binding protein [Sphingobacteriales bacterium]
MKKTLVLGASDNPARYSYKAISSLLNHGHPVIAVGNKNSTVMGLQIGNDLPQSGSVDTVTLYLNPANQRPYYDAILALRPKRIIFNPGTENPELEQLAEDAGIGTVEACTLVMLAVGQY